MILSISEIQIAFVFLLVDFHILWLTSFDNYFGIWFALLVMVAKHNLLCLLGQLIVLLLLIRLFVHAFQLSIHIELIPCSIVVTRCVVVSFEFVSFHLIGSRLILDLLIDLASDGLFRLLLLGCLLVVSSVDLVFPFVEVIHVILDVHRIVSDLVLDWKRHVYLLIFQII